VELSRPHLKINVVERRIEGQTVTTADDGLVCAPEKFWAPGEAHAGSEQQVVAIKFGRGSNRRWKRWIPKRMGACLLLGIELMEEVCRLSVGTPCEAKVQSDVRGNLPVITGVEKGVVLSEVESRISVDDADL
jgi:hypothetical protein